VDGLVDGKPAVDYTDPNSKFLKGRIGLQKFLGAVQFRKVEIKDLTQAAPMPVPLNAGEVDYAAERRAAEKLHDEWKMEISLMDASGKYHGVPADVPLPAIAGQITNIHPHASSSTTDIAQFMQVIAGCRKLSIIYDYRRRIIKTSSDLTHLSARSDLPIVQLVLHTDVMIDDVALDALRAMPTLRNIDMRLPLDNEAVFSRFPKDLSHITSIGHVSNFKPVRVSQKGVDALAAMPNLKKLSFAHIYIEVIRGITPSPTLTSLYTGTNPEATTHRFTDEMAEVLSASKSLTTLGASNSKLTDAGLVHLAKIATLKKLVCKNSSGLTAAAAAKFRAARPDCKLEWDGP
jgi:hypothetical protein